MSSEPQPRAVAYGRNSSAKQKSINDQGIDNRAAVVENDWLLVDELSDPVSASRYAKKVRANWQRLLELLPTVDVVVLWEPSRGDRTLASWAEFLELAAKHSVRVHATSHHRTYDPRIARDWRSLAEDGVDSDYESRKISDRTVRGKRTSAAAGRPQSRVVFGYERHFDPITKVYVEEVEHPEHGPVVREIFASLLAGESLTSVARRLTERGGTGRDRWRYADVRRIASLRRYAAHPDDPDRGVFPYLGEELIGTWPPLVDEGAWQAVQRIVNPEDPEERARRRASAPGAVRYLLSGSQHLLTAPCGSLMSGAPRTGGGNAPGYRCAADSCVAVPMAEADEYVTRLVVARMSKRNARHLWLADDAASKAAAKDLARLERQLAEALALYEADEISGKAYSVKEKKLTPLIEDARRRSRPAGAPLAVLKLLDAAKVDKELARPTFDSFELLAKREVIASAFTSLVLAPVTDRITRWTLPEERLDIVSARIQYAWREPSVS